MKQRHGFPALSGVSVPASGVSCVLDTVGVLLLGVPSPQNRN